MFEKVSQIAEQAATNVSRRRFLKGLSRLAAGVSLALGGLVAGTARAGRPAGKLLCCIYHCEPRDPCGRADHRYKCLRRNKCPGRVKGCRLEIEREVVDCTECP